jgi:hypothetical protein
MCEHFVNFQKDLSVTRMDVDYLSITPDRGVLRPGVEPEITVYMNWNSVLL